VARVSRGSRSPWRDAGFVTLRRSRRGVLTCLSRRTGVQVGAIFDVRAFLTPPLAAERMVRLSHENGVFVQKCLLERKRSYLTEKGLFSCKAACRPACTHMPCYRSATPWGGLGQYAASRSPMSSAKTGGSALPGSVATVNPACAVLINVVKN
jgi:hypothetical protein